MSNRQEVYDRAKTSMQVIGNPKPGEPGKDGVTEGEHYDVLAYTDYADMFIPTVVHWQNGETDSFEDLETSEKNKQESLEQ